MPLVRKTITKTTEVEIFDRFICDCCGDEKKLTWDCHRPVATHVIKISGGYASDYPEDLTTVEIAICDKCLESWVKTFKHKPVESSYLLC